MLLSKGGTEMCSSTGGERLLNGMLQLLHAGKMACGGRYLTILTFFDIR